jgi:hypothetical protein
MKIRLNMAEEAAMKIWGGWGGGLSFWSVGAGHSVGPQAVPCAVMRNGILCAAACVCPSDHLVHGYAAGRPDDPGPVWPGLVWSGLAWLLIRAMLPHALNIAIRRGVNSA